MSGPYDRIAIFTREAPPPPPTKQASKIKSDYLSTQSIFADVAAAVQSNLTMPKAMPQLPPGIAIPLAPPAFAASTSSSSGQALGVAQALPSAVLQPPPGASAALPIGPATSPEPAFGALPKTSSKASSSLSSSSSTAWSGYAADAVGLDEFLGPGFHPAFAEEEPFADPGQGALIEDGAGNFLQLQSASPENQIEIVPQGLGTEDGFFPWVPAPSAASNVLAVPKVVMPAQLPVAQLKNKPLAEPPLPLPLPENARQPLHQHKLHEKSLTWSEVLDGIKESADNGHSVTVAKLAAMPDPDGDSDEENEAAAQPQAFNDANALDEDLFGFNAVDAKQNAKTVATYKTAQTQQPGQEEGFRLSRMILMRFGVKDSVDSVIHISDKKDAFGSRYRLTAGQVMRFGIAAWFGFLRPDEVLSSHTTRAFSWRSGTPVVEYYLPFRKNRPASPYSALYKCCCSYTPYLDIPLCPVHCIDESNFKYVQKVMSAEVWRKCLRTILHNAGLPLYSVSGRPRDHVNDTNSQVIGEHCDDGMCLQMSRAMDARDILRCCSDKHATATGWNAPKFLSAMACVGFLTIEQANNMIQTVMSAIMGSLDSKGLVRPAIPFEKVCQIFWRTLRIILAGPKLIPSDLRRGPVAQGAAAGALGPPNETEVERYSRRVNLTMLANFHMKFDHEIEMHGRDILLKAEAICETASLRAENERMRAEMRTIKRNPGGNKNTPPGNKNTPPGNKNTNTLSGNTDDRGGVLGKYMKPGESRTSPFRKNPKERIVCWKWVKGCCGETVNGKCPEGLGRHGGSSRRIQHVNAEKQSGWTEEECRAKATEPASQAPPYPGKMSEATDYHKEILKDFHRKYGAGSVLPDCVRDCIRFVKESSIEELTAKNRFVARMMVRVHADPYEAEKLEHMQLPQHLATLYRDKCFLFMEKLAVWAINESPELQQRKDETLSIFAKMKRGLSTRGEISPSGFWRLLPTHEREANKMEAESEIRNQSTRKPYDHWASEAQIEEMLRQTETNIKKGIWKVLNIPHGGVEAKKVFPVEQSQKTRLCCDFRMRNLMMYALEKMRMLGVRATQEATARCMSPFADQCSLSAFKSDMKADVDTEKANREATKESATAEAEARHKADFEFLAQSARKLEQRIDENTIGDAPYGFVPFSSKKDLSAYYYQYGVDAPERNRLWVPLPRSKRGSRRGAPRSWLLIESICSLFGSLGSVYECVHGSEVHMLIINRILRVITTIYIDDLHSQSKEELAEQDAALVSLYLSLAGWPESEEKRECHGRKLKRSLIVLGVAYDLGPDARWISMSIDPSRIDKLLDMGKRLKVQLSRRCVEFDLLNSFKGLFRHVAQLVPTFNHLVRGLDCWTVEEYFQAHIRDEKERRALGALIGLLLSCVPFAQKVQLSPHFFDMPISHIYSDAAVEDVQELSKLLKKGVRKGLDRFKMKIGALIVRPDGTTSFFSCDLDCLPSFCDKMHIGVLECMACRVASQAFLPETKSNYCVYHIDNLGAVFSMSKNSSSCWISQGIGASFAKQQLKRGSKCHCHARSCVT
eukprot:g14439.t1